MFEFMLAFMFGGSIAAVFMIVLTIACFKVLADLIGFPTDEVSFIINMIIKYFWPAFVAGGFLTSVTKKKRMALLDKFGTIDKIMSAKVEELCEVEGIGIALAKKIYDYFKEQR